jgi:hypothetical protein
MSKTILLGSGGTAKFDVKVQKWNYFFLGALFITQGVTYFYRIDDGVWTNVMMNLTFLSGVYLIGFALINFSRTSKYSPKLKIDDTCVELKTSLFKKSKKLNWLDIQSVRFKSFRIDFKTLSTVEVFAYDCTSDISVDIKEAIRDVAEKKNIEVIGG